MAYPYWITKAGDLGIISELEFYQLQLEARDPDELTNNTGLQYEVLAGELPAGIILTLSGIIKGTPQPAFVLRGVPLEVNENITNKFVIRVTDVENFVSDRTFTLTVEGPDDPEWFTGTGIIFETVDGEEINYQLVAIDTDNDPLTYTLKSGEIPSGLTIKSDGNIIGRINRLETSKDFKFTVTVTDNNIIIDRDFIIRIYAVADFTIDTTIDAFGKEIRVDADMGYWSSDRYYIHQPYMIKTYAQNKIRHDNNYVEKFPAGTLQPALYVEFELLGILPDNLIFINNYESTAFDQMASCLIHGNILTSSATIRNYTFQLRPNHIYTTPAGEYNERRIINIYGDYQDYTLPIIGFLNTEVIWLTETLLGTLSTGKICKFNIAVIDPNGGNIFIRLKRSSDAGKLPQGLRIDQEGNIVGRLAFGNLTVFDNDTTIFSDLGNITDFDKLYKFWVEAYSNIGPISEIEILEGGVGFTSNPTLTIMGGNGYGARAFATIIGDTIASITIENGGDGYTSEPTIIIEGGNGTGAILRGNIAGGVGISAYKQYYIKVYSISYKPWQTLYAVALPELEDRENWRTFVSDLNIFEQEALYRKTDSNFGIQKTPRILVKTGLNPLRLTEYMKVLEDYHYTKTIKFGELKSARSYNEILSEQYEIIYYEINENYDSTDTNNQLIGNLTTDIFPNSFNNIREHLKLNIEEIVSEISIVPDWMYDKQEDNTIIGFKPVIPLAYVKPGESEKIKFRILKSQFNPNDFFFQIDRYEWDVNLSESYDLENDEYAFRNITIFDSNITSFDIGDMQFVDVIQQIIGSGIIKEFTLDHYVNHSAELSIMNPTIFGEIINITQASPTVITSKSVHNLISGSYVRIINLPGYGGIYDHADISFDVTGMTELNQKQFYISVLSDNTFELYEDVLLSIPVDSTGYTVYIRGGTYISDSFFLIPVKDYVAQFNQIKFTVPPLLNDSVYLSYLKYNPEKYTEGNTGDKWMKFPKTEIY